MKQVKSSKGIKFFFFQCQLTIQPCHNYVRKILLLIVGMRLWDGLETFCLVTKIIDGRSKLRITKPTSQKGSREKKSERPINIAESSFHFSNSFCLFFFQRSLVHKLLSGQILNTRKTKFSLLETFINYPSSISHLKFSFFREKWDLVNWNKPVSLSQSLWLHYAQKPPSFVWPAQMQLSQIKLLMSLTTPTIKRFCIGLKRLHLHQFLTDSQEGGFWLTQRTMRAK